MDSQATISLMRADLAHMRDQYEEKCRELDQEREKVLMAQQEQDQLSIRIQ